VWFIAPESPEQGSAYAVACPFLVDAQIHGAVALELNPAARTPTRSIMRWLQWGAAWIERTAARNELLAREAERQRLATAMDIVAMAVEQGGFHPACQSAVTHLASALDCDRVGFGMRGRGHAQVFALSHTAHFGRRMNLVRRIGSAMDETLDQRATIPWPQEEDAGTGLILRAHEELAAEHGSPAILTVVADAPGPRGAALTLERATPFGDAEAAMCETVAALIAPVLEEKRRNDRLIWAKIIDALGTQTARLFGPRYVGRKLAAIALAATVAFFWYARVVYRVPAQAVLEGEVQRAIVAPFDGYIVSQTGRAGDEMREGQVIAALDDRDLVLNRLSVIATRRQRLKEYDRALAESQRAEVSIIKAQIEQAEAQIALLDEQLARIEMTAPFDGIVVSGDLSQSVGAPVQRGQTLFEIAPLDAYRVALFVDEADIARIEVGQTGSLLISSLPDDAVRFMVTRMTPITETREGQNVFRVEGRLETASDRLRPGMKGVGKIEVGERRLV